MNVFAIDDLVINEGASYSNAETISILRQATGLAESQAHVARRYGRRPVMAGLERAARRNYLETWFLSGDQVSNKKLLYQYLNTDQETIRRLTAMNAVPAVRFGKDVLLAFGPWDVYADAAGDWHVRSLLLPEIEADLSGAVHFIEGDWASATLRDAATVNYVKNPVAGGNSCYSNYNGGVLARSQDRYLFDSCTLSSFVLTASNTNEGGQWDLSSMPAGVCYVSFWMYSTDVTSAGLQVSLNGTDWYDVTALETSGEWTRCGAAVSLVASSTDLYVRVSAAITAAASSGWTTTPGAGWTTTPGAGWTSFVAQAVVYLDGLQVEQGLAATTLLWGGMEGYGWVSTAHASATELPRAVLAGDTFGEHARALMIEEQLTNQVHNPVAGGVGSFGDSGNWVVTRSEDVFLFDHVECKSFKVTSSGAGSLILDTSSLFNHTHYVSFWLYGELPRGVTLRIKIGATGDYATTVLETAGGWTRYGVQVAASDAYGATMIAIEQSVSGSGTFYLDGIQVEMRDYPTSLAWGGAGRGYFWTGVDHGSSSVRGVTRFGLDDCVDLVSGNNTLTFHFVIRMPYEASGVWPFLCYLMRITDGANFFDLTYDANLDQFKIRLEGNSYYSTVQTWIAGTWLPITLMLDFSHEMRLWVAGQQELCIDISGLTPRKWPSGSSWELGGSGAYYKVNAAFAEFVVYDRALTCAEVQRLHAGMGARETRWVNVQAEQVQPRTEGGRRLAFATMATLVLDGDTRWRSRDGDYAPWRVYDEESSLLVNVDSDDDVYPELRITPKVAKSSGFLYKRWIPVVWKATASGTNYPICIEPADLTGKAQADGDDVRVYVGGTEVDRWLGGTLVSALKVWFNRDFDPSVSATLGVAIGAGDTVTEIVASTDIGDFPEAGILLIDDEAFIYGSKNTATRTFGDVTRAVKGTGAAAHTTADTIWWVQHDVWLYYGDSSLSAPSTDDDYKPAFDLDASSNGSWVYAEFGDDGGVRSGGWVAQAIVGTDAEFYGGNHGAAASPWIEIGLKTEWDVNHGDKQRWKLYNPCGISSVNFSNGEKYRDASFQYWNGWVKSSLTENFWTTEYTIPYPTNNGVWENWNYSAAITAGSKWVCLECFWSQNYIGGAGNFMCYLECADITLTLNASYIPITSVGSEQSNYSLNCTITNETTGDAVTLEVGIEIDTVVIVDTLSKTIRLADGTSLFYALSTNTARRDWLRLVPGENVLTYEETDAEEVEIDILWTRRRFE